MSKLKIEKIHTLVTVDDDYRVLHDVDVVLAGDKIEAVGPNLPTPEGARVLDGRWCVAYPGFVNTHHHFYQTLTRNIPAVQNSKLFDWLLWLYEVWRGLHPEAVRVSTQVALGELLLSGCTTSTDHFYVFPQSAPQEFLDIEIDTAREIGVRFHPTRGSMSLGRSQGGLPPDDVTQSGEAIMADCERLIRKYHDPKPFAMTRIVLAPCSPFSVSKESLAETAVYAREKKVYLHTHLCETQDEQDYCLQKLGMRPLDYMESVGWVGPDVWYAHGIWFTPEEIKRLGQMKCGVAHCPVSNLRLGSGICHIPALLEAGVRVGIAVDGSASNDSSNLLKEMQTALLVHRVGTGVTSMPPDKVIRMATRGGAEILGQPEIGQIKPGMAADLALFRLDRIDFAGAMTDPAHALLFCGSAPRAEYTIVAGRVLVEKGRLAGLDEQDVFQRANQLTADLLRKAGH
ncbi:MAG TPA: 8-oxoguanine deaminase [Kiritimatiellia bacterium]|jgi:cytosine/adenosine deaminase-related metal-dependent hydrolase|nr:8-oxoguanine deaminase [Kiritimatiellia bacterium]OQC57915.1 MAG: 8-oxoguanine deaminase [Verrucomicrobia bacterium ADurb.Bin018]MBP9572549.1 8-oxoguanine deaminase [Kiritimatiellia bacterium]HOE00440.1 8-oxoguanine deaminase [Kiritimatiellia bacterium]HOU59096.1 8-oxoguanine deaminase [Kiritimatiellia bacterium]